LSNRDGAFLQLAIKAAHRSVERFRHGAVLVIGGSVHAVGWNQNFLDPEYHKDAPKLSYHAEEKVIRRVKDCSGGVLYVARINSVGSAMYSRPCSDCFRIIRSNGIKKVIYS